MRHTIALSLLCAATILAGCKDTGKWEMHAKAALTAHAAVEATQEVTRQAHHDALSEVIAANAAAGTAAAEALARKESERWEALYDGVNLLADATNAYVSTVVTVLELEEQGLEGSWAPAMDAAKHLVQAWASARSLALELDVHDFPEPPSILLKLVDAAKEER